MTPLARGAETVFVPPFTSHSPKYSVKELLPISQSCLQLFYLVDNFPMLPYTTFMTHEEARKRLTPLETRFTKEYPIDWVGSAAYMRASGTTNKKSASVQASKFLKKQKIQDAIQVYVKEQLGPLEKHLLENVEFWISIRDDSTVTPTVRLKASEALAKYEQMFVEKKEVSIEGQVRIIDDV